MPKLIRITTVPMALRYLLPGQMRFMKEQGMEVLMISADGKELSEVIEQEQCRHIIVPLTRKITPIHDLICLFRLIRIFIKEKPDIVHTHTPKAGLLGMLAAKFSSVPIRIHTVAGLPMMVEKGFKYWLLKTMEKLTYWAATQVWPNSPSLLQFISTHQLTEPAKLRLIGPGSSNGINTELFNRDNMDAATLHSIRQNIQYDEKNTYLLFIGRLVTDKGIPELIGVFTAMQKDHEQLKLILVGEREDALDPLPKNCLEVIENDPNVIHIPWTQEVKYYMYLANYFIFPSHREGFPNVLLQAGAMQLPVICSRIPGNIDIIRHKETGLIFETGNEDEMRACLETALGDPEAMHQMALVLAEQVNLNYRRENIWQNILDAYKSLLN
ncbi:MAG: glycosyltransferase family 4 protein [Chitinophagaceae bacterium]